MNPTRPSPTGVIMLLVALFAAGCTADRAAASILQEGACERLYLLVRATDAMRDEPSMAGQHRSSVIRLHHRRIVDEAVSSREVIRSRYGDDLAAYYDDVKLAVEGEYARTDRSRPGHDWDALWDDGRQLQDRWGCDPEDEPPVW